jgi:aminoglycoside phosphotransferase (APT) family kinase protein
MMGTKPVSERQKFDVDAPCAPTCARTSRLPRRPDLTVEQFKGGQSNPTFKLSAGRRALRAAHQARPAAKLLPSAHAIDREFRVMDALHKAGFPAPRQSRCAWTNPSSAAPSS